MYNERRDAPPGREGLLYYSNGDPEELELQGGSKERVKQDPVKRIMLLSSDFDQYGGLSDFLRRSGYDVEWLQPDDAPAEMDFTGYDCLFIWPECNGRNGHEILSRIRKSIPDPVLPIVYVGGNRSAAECSEIIRRGASFEIMDGWDAKLLQAKLESVFRLREDYRGLQKRLRDKEQVNAQLLADLDLGQQVQQSFLPPSQLRTENFALEARLYAGGDLSGDYFDYALLSQQRLVLFLADVSGHGIASALLANRLKAFFDENTRTAHRPRLFMERLNKVILDLGDHHHIATAVCAHIDVEESVLTYASAGHRTMYWLEEGGDYAELPTTGPALGMFSEFEINEVNRGFMSGRNRLVTFSDGLVEFKMPDGTWITEEKFRDDVMLPNANLRLEEYIQRLLESSRTMTGKREWDDDVSLLTVDF